MKRYSMEKFYAFVDSLWSFLRKAVVVIVVVLFIFLLLVVLPIYYFLYRSPMSGDIKIQLSNKLAQSGYDPNKIGILRLNSKDVPTKAVRFIYYTQDLGDSYFSYSVNGVINSIVASEGTENHYVADVKTEFGQVFQIQLSDDTSNIVWSKSLWEGRSGTVVEIVEETEDSESESLCGQEYCAPHESIKYLKAGDKINIYYYSEILPEEAIKDNIYFTNAILNMPVTTITVNEAGL